jgi:hypothetical protein
MITVALALGGSGLASAVGPTFWWGGTVTDANPHALFGQAFLEVQFYPDSIVSNCTPDGGFSVTHAPDKFSVCSPVWQLSPNFAETAAFNAELFNGASSQPLVMNAGDTIKIHFFVGAPGQGWNINVRDVTTGQSGTIVLSSKYGPMLPAFDTQQIGNALGWGLVDDTPNSFVWEIGHTSLYTHPADQFCVPGHSICRAEGPARDHWAHLAQPARSTRCQRPAMPPARRSWRGQAGAPPAAWPALNAAAAHPQRRQVAPRRAVSAPCHRAGAPAAPCCATGAARRPACEPAGRRPGESRAGLTCCDGGKSHRGMGHRPRAAGRYFPAAPGQPWNTRPAWPPELPAVDLAAMPGVKHQDDELALIDRVQDPVIADPDAQHAMSPR